MHIAESLAVRVRSEQLTIPPYPAVAAKLVEVARGRQLASISELAKIVAADAVLTAQVVGRATSAAHAATGHVPKLFDALTRIGVVELQELALAAGLGAAVTSPGILSALRRDLWRRSLLAAQLARMLAEGRGIPADTAYTAGLVHELGTSVAIGVMEELAPKTTRPASAWRSLAEGHRAAIGRLIARRWKLPEPLAEVIARDPDQPPASELVALVALCDKIIARLDGMPTSGIAAIMDFQELSDLERCSIGSVVQEVVRQMAAYPAVQSTGVTTPVVEATPSPPAFPASLDVRHRGRSGRATAIADNRIVFASQAALSTNWLAELAVGPEPLRVLVKVCKCERERGGHVVEAQPYALDDVTLERWMQLVTVAEAGAGVHAAAG